MRKKNDPWEGLIQEEPEPALKLHQEVKVVRGKHKGKQGKVHFYRTEGDGGRITIITDTDTIYVDQEDIDFKFKAIEIIVMMDDDTRAEWLARIKEIEESDYYS